MRQKPDKDNYFHCENLDCDFKSKTRRHINYFKGQFLCHHCKNKQSICLTNIPTSNPSFNTLYKNTRLPEGRFMPKERYKDYTKVTPELKEWAEHQESKQHGSHRQGNSSDGHIFRVGLSKAERQRLWTYHKQKGMDEVQILREIEKVKNQITLAHKQYKLGLKTKESFKEEFDKMVNR